MKPRKRGLASLLSLLSVGLGQIYNGEPKKAALFLLLQYLVATAVIFGYRSFHLMIACAVCGLIVYLCNIVQAISSAGSKRQYQLKSYNRWYFYLAYLCFFALVPPVLVDIRGSHVEAFKVPSSSMSPTLQIGDHFIVDKSWYREHLPARGDIVVFRSPQEPEVSVIKRVVAIGGDTIELKGTRLMVNGQEVREPYATYTQGAMKGIDSMLVPQGKLIVLGDNRDASKDSRYYTDEKGVPYPFIDNAALKGKALYTYYSSALQWNRIGVELK